MDKKQLVMLALQVSIVCTVFAYGLKTTPASLLYVVRRPGLLMRSLFGVFVIMPALAFGLASLDISHEVKVALVALAISPVPPLLPLKQMRAGGRTSYGLGLLALLALLSIVSIPLTVAVLERGAGRPFAVAPSVIARFALITVLAPLVAGIIVHAQAPAMAQRIAPRLSLWAEVLLVVAGAVTLASMWRSPWEATGQGAIVAITVFVVVGLAVGHVLGGPERETSIVLGMSCACRHPAIAFSVASANFPDQRFGGAIILYLVLSFLIGIPYVWWHRPRLAG